MMLYHGTTVDREFAVLEKESWVSEDIFTACLYAFMRQHDRGYEAVVCVIDADNTKWCKHVVLPTGKLKCSARVIRRDPIRHYFPVLTQAQQRLFTRCVEITDVTSLLRR